MIKAKIASTKRMWIKKLALKTKTPNSQPIIKINAKTFKTALISLFVL